MMSDLKREGRDSVTERREEMIWSQIYVDTLRIRCFKECRVFSVRPTDLEECTTPNHSYCAISTQGKINVQGNPSVQGPLEIYSSLLRTG